MAQEIEHYWMYAFCLFSFSFTSVKQICMCLSTSSLFLIPFLVCVVSVTLFFLTSYLFCFQVGSTYKLSVLNLSSSRCRQNSLVRCCSSISVSCSSSAGFTVLCSGTVVPHSPACCFWMLWEKQFPLRCSCSV